METTLILLAQLINSYVDRLSGLYINLYNHIWNNYRKKDLIMKNICHFIRYFLSAPKKIYAYSRKKNLSFLPTMVKLY